VGDGVIVFVGEGVVVSVGEGVVVGVGDEVGDGEGDGVTAATAGGSVTLGFVAGDQRVAVAVSSVIRPDGANARAAKPAQ
jgi:hypothetical protein